MKVTISALTLLLFMADAVHAAISVDSATIARVAGVPADNVNITSASFTPPANSLLLVFVNADVTADNDITILTTDSQGLTWTNVQEADLGSGIPRHGHTSVWAAQVVSSVSMTISVKRASSGGGGSDRLTFKTYIISGHDTSQPIGASSKGGSTTNNLTATVFNSTVNNSRALGAMTDWNALGTPTSTDTADAAHYASQISVISVFKAADTATAGTSVTLNFDAAGASGADTTWVAVEIRPDGAGSQACTSPAGVSGELKWDAGSSRVKYCSAGAWYDTSHATGASCAGTTSGTINYASGELSFCNGSNWISMKGSYLSSCVGTEAGTFNFSGNKYRYCDGVDWFQMGPSEINFRQLQENTTVTSSNSISTGVYSSTVGQRNLLICWVFYNSSSASISSLSDTNGNTYAKAVGPQTGTSSLSNWRQEIWYAANVIGGASLNTTANFSSTFATSKNISCHEYSGAAMTSPVDQTTQTTGTSANAATGNVTTTSDNQMIFGAMAYSSAGALAGANFTKRSALNGNASEDRSAPTAGSYNATFTHATSADWIAQLVSIKSQ